MRRITIGTLLVLGLGLAAGSQLFAQDNSAVQEIKMTAQRYEFSPNEIHVKQGQTVRLVLTATDHTHGIEIKEFHVKTKLPQGETKTVEFVATKKGMFEFHCSEFCGLGHRKMKGKIIVE
ncbi:MAG: cupredoxin domain-containing protein [Acidobacteriia bacterium]|nr:cupredoxin domain-containing protein [Terriglobia bacterium]